MADVVLNKYKIRAYSTLVKAGIYILNETDRESAEQILVPSDYTVTVSEYIVK